MKIGDLIEWKGRIGLIVSASNRELVVLFCGSDPREYYFDHQWFEWAKRKKAMVLIG